MKLNLRSERGQSTGEIAIAIAVIALIAIVICFFGFAKTPADKIALSYGGGPFEGNQFQQVVEPGSGLTWNGLLDQWVEYPITVRSYIISANEDEGDRHKKDSVHAKTSEGVPVEWELAIYGKLNTDPDKIRKFHETVGLKYQAWKPEGWNQMLDDTLRQQIETSIQRESQRHSADDYQKRPDVLNEVQTGIAKDLRDSFKHAIGDDFFCGPTYDRNIKGEDGKPVCPDFQVVVKRATLPDSVVKTYSDQKEADNRIITAQKNGDAGIQEKVKGAEALVEEAKGKTKAAEENAKLYTDPNYLKWLEAQAKLECAKRPDCTQVNVDGDGAGVNVNTGK